MGVDLCFRLERAIGWRPDAASLQVRLVALMLSKRAEQSSSDAHSEGNSDDAAQKWKILSAECWEHVARSCPVTVCPEWVVCPFDHWLDLSASEFRAAYRHFETQTENVLRELPEGFRADEDHDWESANLSDERREELDEIARTAQWDIFSRAFGDDGAESVLSVDASLGCLSPYKSEAQFFFRYAGHRSETGWTRVRPLGCVRQGIPIDAAKPMLWLQQWFDEGPRADWRGMFYEGENIIMRDYIEDIFDQYQYGGFCFCTLDGLFAVDWDLDCNSGLSSGLHLRPRGKVRDFWESGNLASWLEEHSLSNLRDMMQKDRENVSEHMKDQLQRGHEAMMLLDVHGQELDDQQDDAYYAYKDYCAGFFSRNTRYPTPREKHSWSEGKTRRQIMTKCASGQDWDSVENVKELEKRIVDAGADPTHFRVIAFFCC